MTTLSTAAVGSFPFLTWMQGNQDIANCVLLADQI